MRKLCKGILFSVMIAGVLTVATAMTVNAQAAITSFIMDRTNIQPGQSINVTVQTNSATTHVFVEVPGAPNPRVWGTQDSYVGGIRTWSVLVHPHAHATEIRVFANINAHTAGAVALTIPITVGGGTGQLPHPPVGPGPGPGGVGVMDIVSITEIPALAVNQVRLEVVTGTDVNEVWTYVRTAVPAGRDVRWIRAGAPVSRDANTQTWHLVINTPPAVNQVITVSANRTYVATGATTRQHTLRHTALFIPPANPLIVPGSLRANPVEVVLGGSSIINLTTNADVNYVWTTVNGVRVNATRTNPGAAATAMRTWTMTVHPTVTGNLTVYANAVNSPENAVTQHVWLNALQTRVLISHAHVSWSFPENATSDNATRVRVVVHTNQFATNVDVLVGGTRFEMSFHDSVLVGNTRMWSQEFDRGTPHRFTHASQIQISADDRGNWFTGTGHPTVVTLAGVGHPFVQGQHGQQNLGIVWDHSFEPAIVSRHQWWPVDVTFTTGNDVTEVRVRCDTWTMITPATAHFVHGENNTRIWTISSMFPRVQDGQNTLGLIVQVRRGTAQWHDSQTVLLPISG